MSGVPVIVEIDENFGILYKNINGLRSDDNQTIIITLTRFRKSVSFQWLNSFQRVNPQLCLSVVISTILNFTEYSDATVRVNAYSTLGALLLCVAPFSPMLFIRAFGSATSQLPVSPKMSVAIINMFVYLSRFVSPVRITEFVAMVPVVHHFGVDVSDYIQHLPTIIPLMKILPVEFHQNILRSILVSCGRKPNFAFANTVYQLISLNKEQLTQDCMSFLAGNQLEDAIVWLGPFLLGDDEIYNYLGVEYRELFLSHAIKIFTRQKPQLSLFEYSCKIANIFLKKSRGSDLEEAIHTRIYAAIPENLSLPFKTKLLHLPTPLSEIKLEEKDADSVKGAKLNAAVTYFIDPYNSGKVDADDVAAFFLPFKDSENDLYCTFVECFGNCIEELLKRCKKNIHIELLEAILRKKNKNWVHDETVCKMIDRIPLSLVMKQFPIYQELVFERLLEYTLSTTDRLYNSATDSLIKVASYTNINDLLSKIYRSDWMTEGVAMRRFRLLARLSDLFRTSSFQMFVDIAYESILLYDNINLLSNAYEFLSHVPIDHMPDSIRTFSFEFIARQYQSFSHRKMDYPQNHYDVPIPQGSFIETLDTDIVANPTFDHVSVMMPVMNCFSFLYSIPRALLQDTDTLFWDSYYLVPILGHYALDAARTLIDIANPYYDNLWSLGLETFKVTSKDEVSAACVKLFTNCPKPLPPVVNEMLQKYLQTAGTAPELVFLAFIIVDQDNHEIAMEGVFNLISQLGEIEASKILFKLVHVMGSSLLKDIKDEHAAALLQYAVDIGEPFSERVKKYFENTPFDKWPVGDPEMDSCTFKFMSKCEKTKLPMEILAKLDREHWDFVIVYNSIFELENVPIFIEENPDIFAKIDVSFFRIPEQPPEPFEYKKVTGKLTIASIQPNVKRNELPDDLALITSFLTAGKVKLTDEMFSKMFNLVYEKEDIKTMKSVLNYAIRNKNDVDIDKLLSNQKFRNDDELFSLIVQLQKTQIKDLPENIKEYIEEKIGTKISPELICECDKNVKISDLIKLDPSYFVNYIIEQEDYKAHRLLKLMPLMSSIQIESDQLSILITKTLPLYNDLTSNRKKIVFLRFVSAALTAIKSQRKTALFQTNLILVNESIDNFLIDFTPSIFNELTNLCQILAPSVPSIENCVKIINNAIMFGVTSIFSIYPLISLVQNTKNENFGVLAQPNFETILQHSLPSIKSNGLRALTFFLAPNSTTKQFQLVNNLAITIYNQFEFYRLYFRTVQSCCLLMSRILVNANVDQIPLPFFSGFVNQFVQRLSSPQFNLAVSLFPQLSLKVGKLFESLLSSCYSSFDVLEAIRETYRVMNENGKRSKEQMFFDFLEKIEAYFLKFPSFESGQILLKVISDGGDNVDAPSYLFSKLPMIVYNFLPLFQTLTLFYKDAKPHMRESVDVIVESMSSVITPASRGQALRMLVSGGDMETATAIAASELDDVSLLNGL